MWKNQPVVGTSVTGLRMQIAHGYNGYLIDDTETAAEYTQKLLTDRELWRTLGENAHETVRKRFLFPTLMLGYLQALLQAYIESSKHSEPEIVCRDITVADAA
jgi:trehalose synthase